MLIPTRSSRYANLGINYARRFQSNVAAGAAAAADKKILKKNSIFVISIPITTSKSYIYCNHRPGKMLAESQLKTIPPLIKLEHKLIKLAIKGWTKLSTSEKSINVKITNLVKQLMRTIAYEENCLRSFPNQKAMIREINEELIESKHPNLVQSEIEKLDISHDQLKPIPLYHPDFQNPTTILNQIYDFRKDNQIKHKKYAILCAIGIPLSLPFALVPIIPNVPGFYIAFRLYCHIKALMGIKHLDYLLETTPSQVRTIQREQEKHDDEEMDEVKLADESTVVETKHLRFQSVAEMDQIYAEHNEKRHLNELVQEDECILINESIINSLVDQLDLEHLREDLLKALEQETKRLNKDIRVGDAVE
ncbi:uncharacterized protein SPAPADRAFT_61840 [Spathaspora passalidarum NRRL Y-27907]|uniref:Uncharacterized protein n=1 Tax=Spathaspora passalidarum (strain NRRL Y-27907 / 11-Y1) TaxID=619300 RepID=G3AR96_SPAPN|nr:uncharacterized protein SPAPADRAFT_61840 [Spathaspora passalidarum NRRL Y-27907]EGW31271.1 hypothetical protein SPAPADRAFT_61840 [Spathaspora passalidarum NRRL Y-27907]